jgi:Putative zinc-finger
VTDIWTDKLSDYLDDELPANERAALESHLAGCATCTETLDELRAVMTSARRLPNDPPARDLWAGIAAAIEPAGQRVTVLRPRWRREFRIGLPQLLAASVALMLLSGGAVWWALQHAPAPAGRPQGTSPGFANNQGTTGAMGQQPVPSAGGSEPMPIGRSGRAGTPALTASADSPRYDATIAELQRVLSEGRGTLDSSTVRVLEQNLAIIDQAVEQARRAVAADPANPYLRSHLAATMKRKADLLRKATVLASAEGQG